MTEPLKHTNRTGGPKRSIEQRERDLIKLAAMYAAGNLTYRQMAEEVCIGRPYTLRHVQIHADITELKKRWTKTMVIDVQTRKLRDLALMDKVHEEALQEYYRSGGTVTKTTKRVISVGGKKTSEIVEQTETRVKDARFLAIVLQCVKQRAEILEYATQRLEISGPGGGPIKTEEVIDVEAVKQVSGLMESEARRKVMRELNYGSAKKESGSNSSDRKAETPANN